MKIGKLFLCVIASAAVLAGCKEKEEDLGVPKISVSESSIEFDETGGAEFARIISLNSSRDWSVAFDPEDASEWLTVTPDNGGASADPQEITIYPDPNPGVDRTAKVIFSTSTVSTEITVTQKGEAGSIEDTYVYHNDFDKTVAEKTDDRWNTWLDQFDGWHNEQGTGYSTETTVYASSGVSARMTSSGVSDGEYSDYEGSGDNYIWFGTGTPYFRITGLALQESRNYILSFGAERNEYEASDNTFNPEEFKVYISDNGEKWVELEYTFAKGTNPVRRWDLASASFTLPETVTSLSIHFASSVPSAYMVDDVILATTTAEVEPVIDFSQGVEISLDGGGDTPEPGDVTPYPDVTNAVYYNDFDKTIVSGTTDLDDQSFPWKNEQGSGIADVNYSYDGVDIRKTSSSTTNDQYTSSLYEASGNNNVFFNSKGQSRYFQINNISLGSDKDYTLYFGAYGNGLTLSKENYKVYISDNGERWVELEYTFPNGAKSSSWDLASTTFTVPDGTSALYIYFGVTETSKCRLDDVALVSSETSGTSIDFSTGGPIGGGETPEPPAEIKNVTVAEFNAAEVNDNVYYRLKGMVSNITNTEYGNFTLTDNTGSVIVWGLKASADASSTSFSEIGLEEGDIVTLVGTRGVHGSTIEVMNAYYETHESGSEPQPEEMTIAEVLSADLGTAVVTEGVVAGIYNRGLVITDGTDNLLVYNKDSGNQAPEVQIGDKVRVSGSRAEYAPLPQMAATYENIEVLSTGNTVNYPEPIVVTSSNISSFDRTECVYIQYEGVLSKSGNYYNVTIEGASVQGSLSYPLASLGLDQYVGKAAVYTGYFAGGADSHYLNMLVVSAEESSTPYLNLSETTKNVGAAAGSFSFNISSNVEWTVSSSDATNFSVEPASGSKDGTVTVTYTENTGTEARQATITVAYGSESKTLTINQSGASTGAEVTDVLTADLFAATETSYTDFSNVSVTSSAVYAGQTARRTEGGDNAIQLRSSGSNSGIVTTTSGGKVKRVVVTWNDATSTSRQLDIYVSNEAYANATELYDTGAQKGEKIGSLSYGETTFEIPGDYKYIGFRSHSGAMFLDKVEVVWEAE